MYKLYIQGNSVDYNITSLADGIKAAVGLYQAIGITVDVVSAWTGEIVFSIGENEIHVSDDVRYAP